MDRSEGEQALMIALYRIALAAIVIIALLITGQTIGCDRAEREYEARLTAKQAGTNP